MTKRAFRNLSQRHLLAMQQLERELGVHPRYRNRRSSVTQDPEAWEKMHKIRLDEEMAKIVQQPTKPK